MRVFFLIFFMASTFPAMVLSGTPGEIEIGGYLRDATLQEFKGKNNKFSDFKGKPLIINVWASWCGPCRAEMGSLERLARRYNHKELNIIGISTDDDPNAAASYIKRSKISFSNYLDHKVFLENMLGANTIPLTILVDAQGRILEKARGAYEWDAPETTGLEEAFHIKLKP